MAISLLEPVLDIADEDLADWLWRLPICSGVRKSAPAERCARCAQKAADLMVEQRQQVLAGIRERLASQGFDAEVTYKDWLAALQRIVELSRASNGECIWSAPAHPNDLLKSRADLERLMSAVERERARLLDEQ
jgi:hypothetical protein